MCGSAWDERVGELTIERMGREPVLFSPSMKDGWMDKRKRRKEAKEPKERNGWLLV